VATKCPPKVSCRVLLRRTSFGKVCTRFALRPGCEERENRAWGGRATIYLDSEGNRIGVHKPAQAFSLAAMPPQGDAVWTGLSSDLGSPALDRRRGAAPRSGRIPV